MNKNNTYTGNQKKLLRYVYDNPNLTRSELSEKAGLSIVSVINFIKRFMTDGLVIENALLDSNGGRRPVTIMTNPDYAYVMGIDIGSYSIKLGLTNLNGDIIHKEEIPNDSAVMPSKTVSISNLLKRVNSIFASYGKNKVLGLGIGISGIVDYENRIIKYCPNISGWKNVNIQHTFGEALQLPTMLDTSARWFAIAESGKSTEKETIIAILIGYSIDAGIIIGKDVLRGREGLAGEIGHFQVASGQVKKCTCGSYDCLENYLTLPEILSDLKKLLHTESLTYEEINTLYKANDKTVTDFFDYLSAMLFSVITNVVKLYNPDKVILDGGVIRIFPQIAELVNSKIRSMPHSVLFSNIEITKGSLDNFHVLKGVCREFAKNLFN